MRNCFAEYSGSMCHTAFTECCNRMLMSLLQSHGACWFPCSCAICL